MSNPYRQAFYSAQAEWHSFKSAEDAERQHRVRAPYFEWYTKGWLPVDRTLPTLDIGCASGQFLYFLRMQGFSNASGIDVDEGQVKLAKALGLAAHCVDAASFLSKTEDTYALITMLDVVEHFSREELFELMEVVCTKLRPGGRLIVCVPNAESPVGLRTYCADITHEQAFSSGSLQAMLFCHGLRPIALRDPFPAPIDLPRKLYRAGTLVTRKIAALHYRALGLPPPTIWSGVLWAMAEKPRN